MSEDISKEPGRRRRPAPPEYEPDDRDYGYDEEPPFPPMVKAAGVIWIVYGILILLNLVVALLLIFVLASQMGGGGVAAAAGGGVCATAIFGLFAAAFLFVGVQSVRGTARDTLGNGVGSIILGVLQVGGVAFYAATGQIIQAGVASVGSGLLILAGVLALVGRGQYRMWKRWQRDQRDREAAERRERRRFRD